MPQVRLILVARRHALHLFEYPAEIERALVPQFVGDLIDLERSLIQHFLGTFNLCVVYIIYKSHIVVLGKQDRQIIRADVEDVGELIQRDLLIDVFIDIFLDRGDGSVLVSLLCSENRRHRPSHSTVIQESTCGTVSAS